MKIGLVFSGGGGKGAYEIGVWKALRELKIDKYIQAVSGASIGAINAAFFAQGDYESAVDMWKNVTLEKIMPISNKEKIKKGLTLTLGSLNMNVVKKYMGNAIQSGNVSKDGARDVINTYFDIDKIKNSGKNLYISCTEMPKFEPKYFKVSMYEEEIVKSIILASACIPTIYESEKILGYSYLDGGLVDNTPIQPVYEEGCDIIIVVLLSKSAFIDREKYKGAKIIELYPSNMEEDVLGGTLNFDDEVRLMRIEMGYQDTMNMLAPIMEIAAFQFKEELEYEEKIKQEEKEAKQLEEDNKKWWKKIISKFTNV